MKRVAFKMFLNPEMLRSINVVMINRGRNLKHDSKMQGFLNILLSVRGNANTFCLPVTQWRQ